MTDTSIRIQSDTRDALRAAKQGGESYDDVLDRLLNSGYREWNTPRAETSLDELYEGGIERGSTRRLEYVIESLGEAEELSDGLIWQSEIWEALTIEELIGGLLEAQYLLDREVKPEDSE